MKIMITSGVALFVLFVIAYPSGSVYSTSILNETTPNGLTDNVTEQVNVPEPDTAEQLNVTEVPLPEEPLMVTTSELDKYGYVTVYTYVSGVCEDNTTRCLAAARDFTVQPFLLVDNQYFSLGSGFPGSESGRIVRISAPEESFIQYDIVQPFFNPEYGTNYWGDCSGRINGGDQLYYSIYNDLLPPPPR